MWETVKLRLPEGALFSEDTQNFLGTQTGLLTSGTLRELALARLRNLVYTNVAMPRGEDGSPLPVVIRIAADKESPRDGRFLEILGFYNPRTQPATIHLKEDRVFHWMKNGALPTESVAQIFKTSGTQARFERLKKGEALEALVAEAAEAEIKRAAPVKTRKD